MDKFSLYALACSTFGLLVGAIPSPLHYRFLDEGLSDGTTTVTSLSTAVEEPTKMVAVIVVMISVCLCIPLCCVMVCFIMKMKESESGMKGAMRDPLKELGLFTAFGYDKMKSMVAKLMPEPNQMIGGEAISLITNDNSDQLQLEQEIGRGSYGIVYKGRLGDTPVAVKQVMFNDADMDGIMEVLDDFKAEVEVMSRLKHKNIVAFLGFTTTPHITVVQEFCGGGNVYELLKGHLKISLTWQVKMALDCCEGMAYLHSKNILHRDLKSPNLLLDDDKSLKLADFGLARLKDAKDGEQTMTQCGTPYWTAPEILKGETYDSPVDVYSFAMCFYELFARKVPFEGRNPMEVAVQVVNQNIRPKIPQSMPLELQAFCRKCWDRKPEGRPTFEDCIDELQRFAREESLDLHNV